MNMQKIELDTLSEYNAIDTLVTYKIWEETGIPFANDATYRRTMDLYPILQYMSMRGIRVDLQKLAIESEKLRNEIAIKQAELNEQCGRELNVNSPKQCADYFYNELKHAPYTSRKTGRPTTDDIALSRLARKGVRQAGLALRLRGDLKLLSTYFTIELDRDKRLRCSWNPRGTATGRLSSSRTIFDTGMNMQNLDPRFKACLMADDDSILVEMDKARAEWVVTAYASQDANMIAVCESGEDVHIATGAMITGLSKELVAKEHKLVEDANDRELIKRLRAPIMPELSKARFLPELFSIRQTAKKANHGLNYRLGYKTFALFNEMPESEAKIIASAYSGVAYPGLMSWWGEIENKIKKTRCLTNCYGRTFRFLGALDVETFYAATAFEPQSTIADLVNTALIECANDHYFPFDFLAQVHDSVLFQVRRSDPRWAASTIMRMARAMNPELTLHGRTFRIDTDAKAGTHWSKKTMTELDLHDYDCLTEQLADLSTR